MNHLRETVRSHLLGLKMRAWRTTKAEEMHYHLDQWRDHGDPQHLDRLAVLIASIRVGDQS